MEIDDDRLRGGASLDNDRAYSATVIATPQGRTGLWVTITDDPELAGAQHGPCVFQPIPGVTPQTGDRCLVVRANSRDDWWIVQFDGADAAALPGPVLRNAGAAAGGVSTTGTTDYDPWAGGPTLTIPDSGDYEVWTNDILIQLGVAALGDGRFTLFKNGVNAGGPLVIFTGRDQFDAASSSYYDVHTLTAGDVLTLQYATNAQTFTFGAGGVKLFARRIA